MVMNRLSHTVSIRGRLLNGVRRLFEEIRYNNIYSQFTLMNYYSVCLTLILDVTLVTIMLDPYVMLMT